MAIIKPPAEADQALTAPFDPLSFFLDLNPALSDFRTDILHGLARSPKAISPKYLYDERGSQLFEQITQLQTYYPTRTERAIMAENAASISEAIGPGRAVFEYGSGASEKIKHLLSVMQSPAGYVAMDISRDHLVSNAAALAGEIDVPVGAICADFTEAVTIPKGYIEGDAGWLGFFPGSTLGNLSRSDAEQFLIRANRTLGENSYFLLGVDLEKDPEILRLAYDEPEGVTAEFNLNLLRRIRSELDARVEIDAFAHEVRIGADPQRIEMHLSAKRDTHIIVDGKRFDFQAGETLHTENSNKFSVDLLDEILAASAWRRKSIWTDPNGHFAVCLLSNS